MSKLLTSVSAQVKKSTPKIKPLLSISNFSRDKPIFYQTVNEVPPELEDQANDLEKLVDTCKKYMNEYGVPRSVLLKDLELILNE